MVQGYKQCPNCTLYIPCVSKKCRACGHQFYTYRTKKIRGKIISDWRTLQRGDKIKVFNDDYYLGKDGSQIFMGNNGIYKVVRLENDGIVMFNKKGFAFQCMMWNKPSKVGIVRTPTKILKKIS